MSFVASAIAGLFAVSQFVSRYRRDDRVRRRRRRLADELAKLQTIRHRIDDSPDRIAAREALREADDLLSGAEQDVAMDRLDADGIEALRSLHRVCAHVADRRLATLPVDRPVRAEAPAGSSAVVGE